MTLMCGCVCNYILKMTGWGSYGFAQKAATSAAANPGWEHDNPNIFYSNLFKFTMPYGKNTIDFW